IFSPARTPARPSAGSRLRISPPKTAARFSKSYATLSPACPPTGSSPRLNSGMRTAILSDIHGNLTAFEAVVADLRETSPDLILHGGDLADGGASSAVIVDRIRDLGWAGVVGNT